MPSESAKSIHQPILLVHGTLDRRIKIEYGEEIFRNINSSEKQFIPISGASHVNLWEIGGVNYTDQVNNFLDSLE